MSTSNQPRIVFKILILGDTMVGKSCVLHRYADDRYSEDSTPTIGVDYRPVYLHLEGQPIKLMIWDTAGQEKFKSITKSFYHGAHGAVIVYDVMQKSTMLSVPNWIKELRHTCGDIPVIVAGNKCESSLKSRVTDDEENAFVEEFDLSDKHFHISAITGENIPEVFSKLSKLMMSNRQVIEISEEKRLNLRKGKQKKSCAC